MKIYHLSHTDLDGYGAQVVANFYFKDVIFSNSNYGREIDEKFAQILGAIETDEAAGYTGGAVVLITDLNLTSAQCEDFTNALAGKNAKIFLLDHHASGAECASAYEWYFLDVSKCATKITYDFFSSMFGEDAKLAKFTDVVNAVDIWLKDDLNFEMGKVGLGLVSGAKEINKIMFERENSEYLFYLLSRAQEFFADANDYIALDNAIHGIKKDFFRSEKDDTLSNLVSAYVVNLLTKNREKFEIKYGETRGILTYNIGNVSVIGNDFLVANPEFDFFIDITNKKTMSFRANGNIDVSAMAKHLVGGGGHVNASGGMFAAFKDGFSYEAIKAQVEDLITKKIQERK